MKKIRTIHAAEIREILGDDWEVIHIYDDDVLLKNKKINNE